jgi:hypothetical protein
MMHTLTPFTFVRRLAVLDMMSAAQTINAEIISLQGGEFVIVGHGLEFGTHVQWVSF